MSRQLRAAVAGAMLAEQLRLCIAAEACERPYPPVEAIDFDSPEAVGRAFELVATVLGFPALDEECKARLVMLFQALAEIIALQGSEMEASFFNLISEEETKCVVRSYAPQASRA